MTLREISLTLPNRPGALAGVARTLARERINLAAISVDSTATKGRVRLVVSDPGRGPLLGRALGQRPPARPEDPAPGGIREHGRGAARLQRRPARERPLHS